MNAPAVVAIVWLIAASQVATTRALLYTLGSGYIWRLRWKRIVLPYAAAAAAGTVVALVVLS